jgi:hypothetical protein
LSINRALHGRARRHHADPRTVFEPRHALSLVTPDRRDARLSQPGTGRGFVVEVCWVVADEAPADRRETIKDGNIAIEEAHHVPPPPALP